MRLMYAAALFCVLEVMLLLYGSFRHSQYEAPMCGLEENPTLDTSSASEQPSIEDKVENCMRMANLNSEPLLTQARDNARYLLDEYRRVIPKRGFEGHRSHCWRESYFTTWQRSIMFWKVVFSGSIGRFDYSMRLSYYPYNDVIYPTLTRLYEKGYYKSCVMCLPNVFLLGYEKCGSSSLFTFIERLVSTSTGILEKKQVTKEMQYWARFEAFEGSKKETPVVESLGRYLINFIPGMELVSAKNKTDVVLIDGTPNYMVEWPVFSHKENNMSNYCLLPAALPTLFPNSKYFAIMRSPIDMVYSNFWFSCTKKRISFGDNTKGPDIFHKLIMPKIHTFNNCVRNESDPAFSAPCSLDSNYSACIRQRTHLFDQCSDDIIANTFAPELPRCGETTLYYGLYYIHIRKWLSLVERKNLFLLTLKELNQSPHIIANDILTFLDLKNLSDDAIEQVIKRVTKKGPSNAQKTVDYKSDPQLYMRADTKLALETFYHPFNLLLSELLNDDKYLWF